jgi:hypothetical protein
VAVRKVVGFKLQLKLKDIQRRAKKARFDLVTAGLQEPELQPLLEKAAKSLKPAVLFDTFAHPDADQQALSPLPGLAYSVVLASLGAGLTEAREKTRQENPGHLPLWDLAEEAALEESTRFAMAILEEEALRESCELSPLTALSEGAALDTALRKLDGSKIGVKAEGGKLLPAASQACSVSWLSKTKGRGKK